MFKEKIKKYIKLKKTKKKLSKSTRVNLSIQQSGLWNLDNSIRRK
jgi:hypothetical protein